MAYVGDTTCIRPVDGIPIAALESVRLTANMFPPDSVAICDRTVPSALDGRPSIARACRATPAHRCTPAPPALDCAACIPAATAAATDPAIAFVVAVSSPPAHGPSPATFPA